MFGGEVAVILHNDLWCWDFGTLESRAGVVAVLQDLPGSQEAANRQYCSHQRSSSGWWYGPCSSCGHPAGSNECTPRIQLCQVGSESRWGLSRLLLQQHAAASAQSCPIQLLSQSGLAGWRSPSTLPVWRHVDRVGHACLEDGPPPSIKHTLLHRTRRTSTSSLLGRKGSGSSTLTCMHCRTPSPSQGPSHFM